MHSLKFSPHKAWHRNVCVLSQWSSSNLMKVYIIYIYNRWLHLTLSHFCVIVKICMRIPYKSLSNWLLFRDLYSHTKTAQRIKALTLSCIRFCSLFVYCHIAQVHHDKYKSSAWVKLHYIQYRSEFCVFRSISQKQCCYRSRNDCWATCQEVSSLAKLNLSVKLFPTLGSGWIWVDTRELKG